MPKGPWLTLPPSSCPSVPLRGSPGSRRLAGCSSLSSQQPSPQWERTEGRPGRNPGQIPEAVTAGQREAQGLWPGGHCRWDKRPGASAGGTAKTRPQPLLQHRKGETQSLWATAGASQGQEKCPRKQVPLNRKHLEETNGIGGPVCRGPQHGLRSPGPRADPRQLWDSVKT